MSEDFKVPLTAAYTDVFTTPQSSLHKADYPNQSWRGGYLTFHKLDLLYDFL
jgi:hypothetical protein